MINKLNCGWVHPLPDKYIKRITIMLNGCWEWNKDRGNGYGEVRERHITGVWRTWLAHRSVFFLKYGKLTTDTLDHLCRNTICVNPDHLEEVTRGENAKRGQDIRMVAHRNGTCIKGHDNSEMYYRKSTGEAVRCRACRRDKRCAKA